MERRYKEGENNWGWRETFIVKVMKALNSRWYLAVLRVVARLLVRRPAHVGALQLLIDEERETWSSLNVQRGANGSMRGGAVSELLMRQSF